MPNIATLWILFGGAFIIATAGKSKELEINGQIRDREVRLIGADGEQKGVVWPCALQKKPGSIW